MALSPLDANIYAKIKRHKDKLDYTDKENNSQPPLVNNDSKEKVVNHITQIQKRLKVEETEQVITDYRNGLNTSELAVKYNCHSTTIYRIVKSAGITHRILSPNDGQIDKMVELYQSGLSLEETGKQVGYSSSTIMKYLKIRGINTRDTCGRERK